jgi:hypothetical protein
VEVWALTSATFHIQSISNQCWGPIVIWVRWCLQFSAEHIAKPTTESDCQSDWGDAYNFRQSTLLNQRWNWLPNWIRWCLQFSAEHVAELNACSGRLVTALTTFRFYFTSSVKDLIAAQSFPVQSTWSPLNCKAKSQLQGNTFEAWRSSLLVLLRSVAMEFSSNKAKMTDHTNRQRWHWHYPFCSKNCFTMNLRQH